MWSNGLKKLQTSIKNLNSFNMALTPLPPPAILKCGGHILQVLLNAYMLIY